MARMAQSHLLRYLPQIKSQCSAGHGNFGGAPRKHRVGTAYVGFPAKRKPASDAMAAARLALGIPKAAGVLVKLQPGSFLESLLGNTSPQGAEANRRGAGCVVAHVGAGGDGCHSGELVARLPPMLARI